MGFNIIKLIINMLYKNRNSLSYNVTKLRQKGKNKGL